MSNTDGLFDAPLDPSLDLSISIVNLSSRDLLRNCLRSICGQDQGLRYEVIVVDNASEDGSVEMMRREFPLVRVIELGHIQGFAANNNVAIRQARGRYIMLLNNDTEVMPGALAAHVGFLEAHPEIGGTGGRTHFPDGRTQLGCARLLPRLEFELYDFLHLNTRWPTHRTFGRSCFGGWDHTSTREIELPIEANTVLRREVVERVGLLDEQFEVVFGEGPDWFRRIRDAGYKIAFVPEADVLHYGGQTWGRTPKNALYYLRQNMYRYYRKHGGWAKAQVFRAIVLITQTVMLGVALVSIPFRVRNTAYRQSAVREAWLNILWGLGLLRPQ